MPISRFIEKSAVKDPHNLNMSLYVNDKLVQHDNTGNMHFKIGDQLEYITKYTTLNKGDLIITGTPAGVGPIKVGDKLKANIEQNKEILTEIIFNVEEDTCLI
jgi:acylpyruvate hydrolase